MSDNGGALQATAFERTKRGEQVVESTLQPDLCAIVTLQQLLLQDNAESKAPDPTKRGRNQQRGLGKEVFSDGHTPGLECVCPLSSDRDGDGV